MERRDSKIYLITGQSHGCLLEIVFFFFIVELMSLRIFSSGIPEKLLEDFPDLNLEQGEKNIESRHFIDREAGSEFCLMGIQ